MSDIDRGPAGRPLHLVGAASALGAPNPGTAEGPECLRAAGLARALRQCGREAFWSAILRPPAAPDAARAAAEFAGELAERVAAVLRLGGLPVVLGGDHSCAVGTWRGVAAVGGATGLIWIDAHLDAHTPATSRSGRLHGMPLAMLLGAAGDAPGGSDAPPLDPRRLCLIGVRSHEAEEAALMARLGVRVFGMDEVRRRGLPAVLDDALAVARGAGGFGVSIDLDAIDPADAPGVGTPVAGGLGGDELGAALRRLRDCPDLVAIELAEFDPHYDGDGRTARLATALLTAALGPGDAELAAMETRHGARHYDPLPVVLVRGEGCWLEDSAGRRYLDMMSAYSANSFGHCHPRLVEALAVQARRLALTSRAYRNDRLPAFLARLTALTGFDQALPMNTGAEAVETAIKAARKWAYTVKGVAPGRAGIIACEGNFHGRTLAAVGLSGEAAYRDGFGPFPPGLTRVPWGDADALEAAIDESTAAFLFEPIQGEAGIVLPPPGYLARCAEICRRHDVLLIADEVQTGLGRTGRLLACEHEGIVPDGLVLGKALGGGLLPVSAFLARRELMQVFGPGEHGSTFGGNPLAAAVALEVLDLLEEERLVERSRQLGEEFLRGLRAVAGAAVREVRGRGLMIGVELAAGGAAGRAAAEALLARGVLTKDTHGSVLRFAPPLVVTREQLAWTTGVVGEVLARLTPGTRRAA